MDYCSGNELTGNGQKTSWDQKDLSSIQVMIVTLSFIVVILMVINAGMMARLCKGKPPKMYQEMLEQAQQMLEKQDKEKKKQVYDLRVILSCSLLFASQIFKLAYYACISYALNRETKREMIFVTQVFESLAQMAILGAYFLELHYWI